MLMTFFNAAGRLQQHRLCTKVTIKKCHRLLKSVIYSRGPRLEDHRISTRDHVKPCSKAFTVKDNLNEQIHSIYHQMKIDCRHKSFFNF